MDTSAASQQLQKSWMMALKVCQVVRQSECAFREVLCLITDERRGLSICMSFPVNATSQEPKFGKKVASTWTQEFMND